MPIIGNVGRRSFKVRFLNVSIHMALIFGSLSMVYPLLIMLSGSVKSAVDSRDLSAIPAYFYDNDMLYKKWIEAKYNESVLEQGYCYRDKAVSFERVEPPEKTVAQRYNDWTAFVRENSGRINENNYSLGSAYGVGTKPELQRNFINVLKAEADVGGDIEELNDKYFTNYVEWDAVGSLNMNLLYRGKRTAFKPFVKRWLEFSAEQGEEHRNYYSLDSFFVEQTLKVKYGQDIRKLNQALGMDFRSWANVTLAKTAPDDGLRENWIFFVRKRLGLQYIAVSDAAVSDYREFLKDKYKKISLYNTRYGAAVGSFEDISLPAEIPFSGSPSADWSYFVESVAKVEHLGITSTEYMYRDFLRAKYKTVTDFIQAHDFGIANLDELKLMKKLPTGNVAWEDDWIEFVDKFAERDWVHPDYAASKDWIDFIAKPYTREKVINVEAMNAALGTDYKDPKRDIIVPDKLPENPALAELWRTFVDEVCPRRLLVLDKVKAEAAWRGFVRSKHANADALNRSYGWYPSGFDKVNMPTSDVDWFLFEQTKQHAFWEFFTRNYAVVAEMMIYSGRAVVNTVIYCGLMILAALIVNPMAAYALSRYKPPSQYKLLLFLMLTMAFPPMVLGIPNFLILRDLKLLNTFAALVLPAMANGYQIFLLKGFFDALPRELYESAQIDGASEWTMFWQITMATSKPILAVIALNAFRIAYANFMLAFIVCQSPKMWTMMVHIYQLMQRSSQGVSFAALVVAAIPTLIVFIFCQNIIIRGIVVPTEK